MLSLKVRERKPSTSSIDSEDERPAKIKAVPTNFRVRKDKTAQGLFTVDSNPISEEATTEVVGGEPELDVADVVIDKQLQKVLAKAKCGPAFEKNPGETAQMEGRRALKRKLKLEREKTAGKEWFDLPATELTDEVRQDLELIRMRAAIDPTRHYKRNDREVLPKYFQIGKVVDAPEDYYSSRMTKKERKKTMVDELLNDMEFLERSKAKYKQIQAVEAKKKRGAFQRRGGPSKKKKDKGDKKKKRN